MKFSFGFLFVLLAVCSLFGGISAGVCESNNPKASAKACTLRCRAKDFEEGKCVEKACVCSQPRESSKENQSNRIYEHAGGGKTRKKWQKY